MSQPYKSGRQQNLNLGITSITENQTILQTIGKVGIGTTNAQNHSLFVVGTTNITGDINVGGASTFIGIGTFNDNLYVRNRLYVGGLEITGGALINEDIVTRNLLVTGISTFGGFVDFNNDIDVDGHTELDNLNVSGIATIQNLDVQGEFDVYDTTATFHNNLFVAGNLSIGGTTTVIQAQDLQVFDKEITLGITTDAFGNDVSNDITANHGGIAIASTEGSPLVDLALVGFSSIPATYKQLMWVAANSYGVGTTDAWMFNYAVGIGSTLVPNGVRLAVSETQFTDDTINTGNINISQNLNVVGSTTLASAGGITTTGGDLYVGGTLYANTIGLTDGSFIGADINTRNLNVSGVSTFIGITTNESTIFGNQLSISGLSTFVGVGTFLNDLYVGETLYTKSITVTGGSTIGIDIDTRNLRVTGISTFLGDSSFDNNVSITGFSTFIGISTFFNNVSIGGSLDVNGDINFNGNLFQNNQPFVASRWTAGQGTEIYRLSNVGIGTTDPTQDLDVNGDIKISGGIYDSTDSSGLFNYVIASDGVGGWDWKQVNQIGAGTINGISVFDEENIIGVAGSITDIYFVGNNISVFGDPGNVAIATVKISETPIFDTLQVNGISTLGFATVSTLYVTGLSTFSDISLTSLNASGIVTAVNGFVGNLTGTATTATNLSDAANITTGTISTDRLSGTYNIDISGNSTTSNYASIAGIATYAEVSGISSYAHNAGISTNLKGGIGGQVIYQSDVDATSFLVNGSAGQVLQSNGGTNPPSWANAAPAGAIIGITIRDEDVLVGSANSVSSINFIGPNITATASGTGATVTVADYVSLSGIASYADVSGVTTALQTSRNFYINGDVATASSVSFNGTEDVDLYVTLSNNFSANTTGIITASEISTGQSGVGINISSDTISGPSVLYIDPAGVGDDTGIVRIKGDLYVDGTETYINSTTIELADFNVGIATTVSTNSLLDGAGIGIGEVSIRKTLTWSNSSSSLKSSENFDLYSGKVYKIDGIEVLSSNGLGTSILNSSLTSVGTLDQLNVSGVSTLGVTTISQLSVGSTSIFYSDVGIKTENTQNYSLYVNGDANIVGVVSATAFYGSGYNLTDLIDTINVSKLDGIEIKDEGSLVGSGATFISIDFRGPGVVATGIGSTAVITIGGGEQGTGESTILFNDNLVSYATTIFNFTGGGISSVYSDISSGITTISIPGTSRLIYTYIAVEGQTTFAATYTVGYVDVYLNGVKLSYPDFTATNGTSVVLTEGASEQDFIEIITYTLNIVRADSLWGSPDQNLGISTISPVTIGSTSVNSTLTVYGNSYISGILTTTLVYGDLVGTASSATKLQNARNFQITGPVTSNVISFDGTNNVSLASSITENSISLGTHTYGDYVQSISGSSNQITVINGTGEGSTPQVGLPSYVVIPYGLTVTSGVVTATSFSGSGSNLTGVVTSINAGVNISVSNIGGSYTITAIAAEAPYAQFAGIATALGEDSNVNTTGIVTASRLSTGTSGIGINVTNNTISGPSEIVIDPSGIGDNTGSLRIKGDLFVDGTQTIINSSTLSISDFVVGIASTATTDILADGAGFKIGSDNTILYVYNGGINPSFKSSENFDLLSGKSYYIDGNEVLSSNTLSSGVVNSSLTSVGTLISLNVGDVNSTGIVTANSFVKTGGTSSQFLKADGSIDSNVYLTTYTETDTLDSVVGRGSATSKNITVGVLTATSINVTIENDYKINDNSVLNSTTLGVGVTNSSLTSVGTLISLNVGNVNSTGIITATDFNSQSDVNLKKNISKIENPIKKLTQISGVNFDWISNNKSSIGVIAQDVEKVLPSLVSQGETKTVNYNGLIALLIECVKEQQTQIEILKNQISGEINS